MAAPAIDPVIRLGELYTWLIVVGGWWIVDCQNNRRESRKEQRAILDRIARDLDELENEARAYHTAEVADPSKSQDIKIRLKRAAAIIKREQLLITGSQPNRPLIEFRKAITLDNFESQSFLRQPDDSLIVLGILSCKDDLLGALEDGFVARFRMPWYRALLGRIGGTGRPS